MRPLRPLIYSLFFLTVILLSCTQTNQVSNDIALLNNDSIFSSLCKKGFKDSAVHTAFKRASLLKARNNWKNFARSLLEVCDSGYTWKKKEIQLNAIDTMFTCEKELFNDTAARVFLAKAIRIWSGFNFKNEYNDTIVNRMNTVWQIFEKDTSISIEAFTIASKLGIAYNIIGDFPKAQFFYLQNYLDALKKMKMKSLASSVINGTILLNELGQFDSSRDLIQNTLTFPGISAKQQSYLYANLAAAYAGKTQFDSAQIPLQKGFSILDTIKDRSDLDERYATLYNGKANVLQSQKQYAAALKTWRQCLVYTVRSNGNSLFSRYAGKVFIGMADNFYLLGQYDSSLYYYHKALRSVVVVDSAKVLSLPAVKDIYSENTIMDALDGKAKALTALYNQRHEQILAQTIIDCYSLAFATENKLLAMYDYEQSKLLQLKISKARSEKAIALCNSLYKRDNNSNWCFLALQFAEKSKAIVLLQSIKKNLAANILSGTDTLLSKANSIQLRINKKQADISKAAKGGAYNKLDSEKTKLTGELQVLQSQIKNAYPQLAKTLSILDTLTLTAIQKNILDTGTALIEYFKGDTIDYVFYINPNGNNNMQQLNKNIDSAIINFTGFFQSPQTITEDPLAYKSAALSMYQQLFPFTSFIAPRHLIIIPDGNIGYIPFEALITNASNTQSLKQFNYLIRQSDISQGYSISSLLQKKNDVATGIQLAAFAPVFAKGERNFSPLPFSNNEIASIENEFSNGKYNVYLDATINALRSQAKNCGLLHIATHASADFKNSEPKIEMIDSTLTLGELYTWRIKAHLVTLSACETGIGNIEKSEGPMSLARGFYYAGAQNVINSLWQVNDAATGTLFNSFYKNIQSNSLSASLQKSKLQYIQNSSNANASPYYWAGFIFIGSSDYQLPQQSNLPIWFAVVAAIIALFLLLMQYKKRKAAR